MNRRQKIIISVTGIFLVLLILVGLTYAYFLTQIQGNENDKSITVTTAKLELVYGDNSAEIIRGTGALMPTVETDADYAIGTKTFTVTNNGNDSSYVVIIDNVSVTKVSDGSATTFVSNDFRYTLTCTKSDGTKCNEVSDLTIFPLKGGILVSNDIKEDDIHSYTLTMWYIDTGLNQSDDMGKSLQARVNIADVNQMENPFKTGDTEKDNASLAYNIIENAKTNKNGTTFANYPITTIAESISSYETGKTIEMTIEEASYNWTYAETEEEASRGTEVNACSDELIGMWLYDVEDFFDKEDTTDLIQVTGCDGDKPMYMQEEILPEKTLSVTPDDYGISYYFRGDVEDNYVNFAGMCWRIVRIAGDGTTKLILEDQYTTCDDTEDTDGTETADYAYTGNWNIGTGNYGYELKNVDSDSSNEYIMNYLKPVTNSSSSMVKLFYDFQTTKLADYIGKLKSGDWCLGDKAYTRSGSSSNYTYTLLEKYNYSSSMYYDAYTRLNGGYANGYQPTLKCNGTVLDKFATVSGVSSEAPMYVSAITADEIVFAGGSSSQRNYDYYLMNEFNIGNCYFWSLSPYHFESIYGGDSVLIVDDTGTLNDYNVYIPDNIRPAVSLASSAVISSGEGTIENPYVVE